VILPFFAFASRPVGRVLATLLLAGSTACSQNGTGSDGTGSSSTGPDAGSPGSGGDVPNVPAGLPAVCTDYAACCYATVGKETCDAILEGLAGSAQFLSAADLASACSGCTLPDTCSSADTLTLTSLRAAKEALSKGGSSAKVTPFGCMKYERNDGGETLSVGSGSNQTVFAAEYGARASTITLTTDGITTYSAQASADAKGALSGLTIAQNDARGSLVRRDVYTPGADDALHVAPEVVTHAGDLVPLAEFDTQEAQAAFGPEPAEVSTKGCTEAQTEALKSLLESAVVEGFDCMRDKQRADIGTFVLANYLGRTITFNCEAKGNNPLVAQIAIMARFTSWLFGSFSVAINTDRFFASGADALSEGVQKNVLFHELLHLYFGAHQPSVGGPRQTEFDPTYACAGMCFPLDNAPTTKCACATCLGTDVCDQRCGGFASCDPDMGASCNALPPKWFASASECASSCTAACDVHDVSCQPCN